VLFSAIWRKWVSRFAVLSRQRPGPFATCSKDKKRPDLGPRGTARKKLSIARASRRESTAVAVSRTTSLVANPGAWDPDGAGLDARRRVGKKKKSDSGEGLRRKKAGLPPWRLGARRGGGLLSQAPACVGRRDSPVGTLVKDRTGVKSLFVEKPTPTVVWALAFPPDGEKKNPARWKLPTRPRGCGTWRRQGAWAEPDDRSPAHEPKKHLSEPWLMRPTA